MTAWTSAPTTRRTPWAGDDIPLPPGSSVHCRNPWASAVATTLMAINFTNCRCRRSVSSAKVADRPVGYRICSTLGTSCVAPLPHLHPMATPGPSFAGRSAPSGSIPPQCQATRLAARDRLSRQFTGFPLAPFSFADIAPTHFWQVFAIKGAPGFLRPSAGRALQARDLLPRFTRGAARESALTEKPTIAIKRRGARAPHGKVTGTYADAYSLSPRPGKPSYSWRSN